MSLKELATLKLKVDDQISFVLGSGRVNYDDDNHLTHMEEDLAIIS